MIHIKTLGSSHEPKTFSYNFALSSLYALETDVSTIKSAEKDESELLEFIRKSVEKRINLNCLNSLEKVLKKGLYQLLEFIRKSVEKRINLNCLNSLEKVLKKGLYQLLEFIRKIVEKRINLNCLNSLEKMLKKRII